MIEGYNQHAWYYELSHAAFVEDVDFYRSWLGTPPQTVLELGCGSGRITIPLATAGHECWGIDNAIAMLALAGRKMAELPAAVQQRLHFLAADMTSFALPQTFEWIIIPHNTLMHLDATGWQRCLHALRPHLAPEGKLLIDLINPHDLLALGAEPPAAPELEAVWIDPADGQEVAQYSHYTFLAQGREPQFNLSWSFEKAGEPPAVIEATYYVRLPHELQLGLKHSGLRLLRLMGGYDGRPFTEESDRLILEATLAKL